MTIKPHYCTNLSVEEERKKIPQYEKPKIIPVHYILTLNRVPEAMLHIQERASHSRQRSRERNEARAPDTQSATKSTAKNDK